jgi:cellulose synthase/poly-beta-1,6-N-acetylglucosamine synthase-like glycosyltransferase
LTFLAVLSLLIWLFLLVGRKGFWRAQPQIENEAAPEPAAWPGVIAVIPARDEAPTVAEALRSLLAQDYPGALKIILVDDHSEDATRTIAQRLRAGAGLERPLAVIGARELPAGWSGKLWAIGDRHSRPSRWSAG